MRFRFREGIWAIIPLGRDSHHGSSSLPEGCSLLAQREPSLARTLDEPGRLSPPIWPCTTRGFPCLACCQLGTQNLQVQTLKPCER